MTLGALRVSALALSAAAFVLSAPLPAAMRRPSLIIISTLLTRGSRTARTGTSRVPRRPRYVARGHAGHRHYVWRNGHRYAYGYNPGAAVAAGVIGGVAAGYPYSCDYPTLGRTAGATTATMPTTDRITATTGRITTLASALAVRLRRSPFPRLRPRASTETGLSSPAETSATALAAATSAGSAAATPAALAAATLAALAAATWAALAAAILAAAGTSTNIRFASPSASGGLRAARFCWAEPAGSKATPS